MKRKVIKQSRPEYFWGGLLQAGIGSLFNVASGLVQTSAQARAAKQMYNRQKELATNQANLANDNNIANSINNMYQAENYNNNQDKYYEYSKGGIATQYPRRDMFARGGKYNFANFANRLERNVNESDNTRVASGRRVVNARNRQYRRDNSLIGKVINYIDKTDTHAQIIRKATLTAQQYRNNKAAQTFGQYDRDNYNGKTYYVPQVQAGIAPTVGISNAGKVASFYNRLNKAKRVFSGAPSVNNLRRQANLPSLETIISGGRNNFKGISNTERSIIPNPVMTKGYKDKGIKGKK